MFKDFRICSLPTATSVRFSKRTYNLTAMTNLTNKIFNRMDKGEASILALLDFSKAFDTLNHILLPATCCRTMHY